MAYIIPLLVIAYNFLLYLIFIKSILTIFKPEKSILFSIKGLIYWIFMYNCLKTKFMSHSSISKPKFVFVSNRMWDHFSGTHFNLDIWGFIVSWNDVFPSRQKSLQICTNNPLVHIFWSRLGSIRYWWVILRWNCYIFCYSKKKVVSMADFFSPVLKRQRRMLNSF